MRQQTCDECSTLLPLHALFRVRDRTLCEACCNEGLARDDIQRHEVERPVDPTVCAFCQADAGEQQWPLLGGVPACRRCDNELRHREFPAWLRFSFVALLLLLGICVYRSSPYFEAETALVRARRHLEAKQYIEASEQLALVLGAAPTSRSALLLKIEADLLHDDFQAAFAGMESARGIEFKGDLIEKVNALIERADAALTELNRATELSKQNKTTEAATAFTTAHERFPESRMLHAAALQGQVAVHFEKKDWDAFLRSAEQFAALLPEEAAAHALVASALAAKFASTGEPSWEARAHEKLAAARALAKSDDARAALAEYEPRIEHRLRSREIIDKAEYDRRFRPEAP